jgi:hypothetical protein
MRKELRCWPRLLGHNQRKLSGDKTKSRLELGELFMVLNVGFVGFDGTENKRAIPEIHQAKELECIKGDMNVLLRAPHARAKSMLSKFTRMYNVRAFLTDEKERVSWESAGVKIEGNYDDFFTESDVVFVGTPGGHEANYVQACLTHGCQTVLMGGAHRVELLKELEMQLKMNQIIQRAKYATPMRSSRS